MCLSVTRYSTLKTKYVKKNESSELGVFHSSLLSKWFREIPNDSVSPVGETSWSRCARFSRRRASWSRCSRSAGDRPPRCPSSSYVFRSFRTLMSIEKRVVLFSRSFRSLIKKHAATQNIKDLKDLNIHSGRACYRHSGPTDLKKTRDVFSVARAMARDRPSPYGEGRFFIVARGPVPRDLHRQVMFLGPLGPTCL